MLLHNRFAITISLVGFAASANAQLPRGVGAPEVTMYSRLLAMTDTRQLDTALIDRALASTWRPMRAAAALAIGQVGAEPGMAGASRLRALLKDPDATVAANAAYALGLLRDTAAIAPLGAALALNPGVAREAAWALGEIGAPARATIIAALKSDRDPDPAIQLLLAASKLRPVPLADISRYLQNSNRAVVWAASYAIARTRAPGGVRALIDLEASPALSARPQTPERSAQTTPAYTDAATANQRTRAEIARGLAKSAAGDSLGPKAFSVLARLVADLDPHVRINAVRSLGTYG
ncbi:MAG TPA: HEAT repeat domain-containing protein, partial [Gemmatimonadaceae bacterium]|nr:HEAT repeat domain-containing protein [Gemmatimonadaceae bacterium]